MSSKKLASIALIGVSAGLYITLAEGAVAYLLAPTEHFHFIARNVALSAIACTAAALILAATAYARPASHRIAWAAGGLFLFQNTLWASRYFIARFQYQSHLNGPSIVAAVIGLVLVILLALAVFKSERRVLLGVLSFAVAILTPLSAMMIQTALDDDAIFRRHYERGLQDSGNAHQGTAPGSAKNLIIILADTLRADALGCYGSAKGLTPNIDRFAQGGVLLADVNSVSSWTRPTVATLMTGLTPREHGMRALFGVMREDQATVAEHLRATGFRTGAVVTNAILKSYFGFGQGFETYMDRTKVDEVSFFFTGRTFARAFGLSTARQSIKSDDAGHAVDRFLDWIDENDGRPFFGYLHLMDPHAPYDPPQPFKERYAPRKAPAFKWLYSDEDLKATEDPAALKTLRSLYDGEVAYMDGELGRLFQELEQRGITGTTRIVFLSDHGEQFREHDGIYHGHSLYREEVHVPLIISGPGIPKGRMVARAKSLIQLPSALFELAGVPIPIGFGGKGLVGLFASDENEPLFMEVDGDLQGGSITLFGVRDVGRKLILDLEKDKQYYFDLALDPGELNNLASSDPEGLAHLLELAQSYEKKYPRKPRIPLDSITDAASRAALRSLGYLR
jgi:choline-sulfatase